MIKNFLRSGARPVLVAATLISSSTFVVEANAADELVLMPLDQVLSSPMAEGKIDGSVRFYLGDTSHPPITQNYGNFVSNKKTNGFGKSAAESCTRVILSTLIQFQDQAKGLGANAVVNMVSFFKQNEVSHNDDVECYKGFLMAGSTLKGDIVRISGN